MEQKKRRFAAASVASAVAIISMNMAFEPGAYADTQHSSVTFSSSPAVATLVAHYEVSPGSQPEAPSTSNDNRQMPLLVPKHAGRDAASSAARRGALTAAPSDSTVAEVGPSDSGGTPPPSASFIGQQGSKKTCSYFAQGCNPPDNALAASPDFVLQGVNTQWEVLDPSGRVEPGWPVSAQRFFGVPDVTRADGSPCDLSHQSQPFLSDPRAFYDARDRRFWAAMLQVENAIGIAPDCPEKTVYFVAVSQTNDPRGAWNVYEFDMSLGTTNVADFTQIGFNDQAVYFSANMFTQDGSAYAYAELFEANKAQMQAGEASFTADGFFNLQAHGPGITSATGPFLADTVQPTINEDKNGSGVEHFVNTLDGPDPANGHLCSNAADACKGLGLWRMSKPIGHDNGGSAPVLSGTYIPHTRPYVFPPPSDQPSCSKCVDASDLRISGTPVYRAGTVYAAWETGVNNGSEVVPGIEWAQVQVGDDDQHSQTLSGYYNFSGDASASYPALMPDATGNLLMVFDYMSHTVFPEARYTLRDRKSAQFTDQGVVLKKGEASYRPTLCGTPTLPVCRWGDYSAASFGGNSAVWFVGQYANSQIATGPPAFGRNWGTWIGALSSD